MAGFAVCADVGSTYTKVAVVDLAGGVLAATAARPTTVDGDVLVGLDAAVADAVGRVGLSSGARRPEWYVCSSAGGGLRLAVVGHEELVSARAGRRVGLSAGARVVHVAAGRLDAAAARALRAAGPDVVLLVGGTDGGDVEVVTHNAARLARARWRRPVVVAGNAEARAEVLGVLSAAGVPATGVANVLPRLGVLAAGPARAAIREVFLRQVIGGKGLSRGRRFASLVRAPTPDAVLAAVRLLSESGVGDVLVVDVGGATTDVYSAVAADAAGPRPVVARLWRERTVEGDLGVRAGAPGVVDAGLAERLLSRGEAVGLAGEAAVRATAGLPGGGAAAVVDLRLAGVAALVGVRRHARAEPGGAGGRDLGDVRLLVGSGGVLRHAPPVRGLPVLSAVLADHGGGWVVPRAAVPVVDVDYVLAAAGLLAEAEPGVAVALLRAHLLARAALT